MSSHFFRGLSLVVVVATSQLPVAVDALDTVLRQTSILGRERFA